MANRLSMVLIVPYFMTIKKNAGSWSLRHVQNERFWLLFVLDEKIHRVTCNAAPNSLSYNFKKRFGTPSVIFYGKTLELHPSRTIIHLKKKHAIKWCGYVAKRWFARSCQALKSYWFGFFSDSSGFNMLFILMIISDYYQIREYLEYKYYCSVYWLFCT